MGHRTRLGWVAAVLLTALAYGVVAVVTGLLACGVSGCTGAGFGPAFAPREAQLGLLLAGVSLAPLAVYLLRGRRPAARVIGATAAVAAGTVLAMVLLGLGPDGCPWGLSRAVAGEDAIEPGSLTCRAG